MRKFRKLAVLIVAVASIAGLPARAEPAAQTVVSMPGSFAAQGFGTGGVAVTTGYQSPVIVIAQTGALIYENLDIQAHNLESYARVARTDPHWDPRYCDTANADCPLFQDFGGTPPSDAGGSRSLLQSAPVLLQMPNGTPKLQANTPYAFFCRYHVNMKGTLIAVPA